MEIVKVWYLAYQTNGSWVPQTSVQIRVIREKDTLSTALFYAQRAILCEAIFVMECFCPSMGGAEAMGEPASLLAKAAPSLLTHRSLESEKRSMTIFLFFQ